MNDSSSGDFIKTESGKSVQAALEGAQAGVELAAAKEEHSAKQADAAKIPADDEIQNPPRRGTLDPNGCPVVNVFASTRHFAVYESDDQIRYMLPSNYDVAKKLRQRVADLGGLRASIEDLRADKSISPNEKTRAAREISWALTQAFEDDGSPPSE